MGPFIAVIKEKKQRVKPIKHEDYRGPIPTEI
jgi:hypothetical protein